MNITDDARIDLDSVEPGNEFHAKLAATIRVNGRFWPVNVGLDDGAGGLVVAGLDSPTVQMMAAMTPGERDDARSLLQAAIRREGPAIAARLAA